MNYFKPGLLFSPQKKADFSCVSGNTTLKQEEPPRTSLFKSYFHTSERFNKFNLGFNRDVNIQSEDETGGREMGSFTADLFSVASYFETLVHFV